MKKNVVRSIAATVVLMVALVAEPALAEEPAPQGGFDKRAFDAGMDNASSKEAINHALSLGVARKNLDAYFFLVSVGAQFVKDENGVFNEKANKQAFTAAVLNITPALLGKAKPFTDEIGEKQVRALVFALLAACDSFVQQPGQFNKTAFNAAFENLNMVKVKKAADLMGTRRDLALSYLLTASGRFLDKTGTFNAPLFNRRFDALKATQFAGTEDEREKIFLNMMKPDETSSSQTTSRGTEAAEGTGTKLAESKLQNVLPPFNGELRGPNLARFSNPNNIDDGPRGRKPLPRSLMKPDETSASQTTSRGTEAAEGTGKELAESELQKLLPPFKGELRGPNLVRVSNPNNFAVAAGIRAGDKGKNFDVPANGTQTVLIPNGTYDIYFVYSDRPDALFQGDSFTLNNNGVAIRLVQVINGNYGIRQVK